MTITQTTRKHLVAIAITASALMGLSAVAAEAQQPQELFNNTNIYGVGNGISGQPTFSLGQATMITEISNYHWNFGQGAQPGSISLRSTSGQSWGPFQARGSSGQGGAQNVNWTASVNVTVPAGTYMVFDSSPNTWSSNQQSGGRGFSRVSGYAVAYANPNPPVRRPVFPTAPALSFVPCAANSNPVAVVGPCVVKRGGILHVQQMRANVIPARLQFLANTVYSTAYNVVTTLTPAGPSHFQMTVPPQLCGPNNSQPTYNVFLIDATGQRQGQIGTFTPDCR